MNAERQLRPVDVNEPATLDFSTLRTVLVDGDLSKLNDQEQVEYYRAVCQSIGIDYRTRPFAYLRLNGRVVLYALRECAEQLRKLYNVSVYIKQREIIDDCYVVTAEARLPNGRIDSSTGVVSIGKTGGEVKANAMMKAETKAKRRVTLSICGLGLLDESETLDIPGAELVDMQEQSNEPDKLTREDAAQLKRDIEEAGCDAEWIKAYLRSAGFKGLGDMTKRDGDVMYRTAVNHRAQQYTKAQPEPEASSEPLFDDDELAAMDKLD